MLKKKLKSLDDVDAKYKDQYVKKADGLFHLDLEADPDDDEPDDEPDDSKTTAAEKKLKEFRKENIRLRKEREELEKRFEGIDPDEYATAMKAMEAARNEEEKQLLRQGKFDEVLDRRYNHLKERYERELEKERERAGLAETTAGQYRGMLHKDRVRTKLRAAADELKLKLLPTAAEDFYSRAERVFTDLDEDGELVALDGEEIKLNDEQKRYSEKDFIQHIVDYAPHLLEAAGGSDIRGSSKKRGLGSGVVEIDPNDPKSFGKNVERIAKGEVDVRPVG